MGVFHEGQSSERFFLHGVEIQPNSSEFFPWDGKTDDEENQGNLF